MCKFSLFSSSNIALTNKIFQYTTQIPFPDMRLSDLTLLIRCLTSDYNGRRCLTSIQFSCSVAHLSSNHELFVHTKVGGNGAC
jgi:hypothetical protein